ncbi:alpha/beta fold hydrolase BchO [Congregibacter litoralis]|uniref:Putative magnesium chelatase accessory protein n=1 Tax=Congregibacter litoralis KT71 TaxID=314285 RepID=A4ACR9_9GAMM|nr:alpha/beta fold hydrolase BchO [Congregibacter litoralis]EAQ96283.1 putative magnesium chelatase accessory protein [Congregibacter litoralis KT71]
MTDYELPENWPDSDSSEFIESSGLRWHVQIRGSGPDLLLLHGTGASSHSWVPMARLLESDFRVIAPDLPGQGFTELAPAAQCSLTGMSRAIAHLLQTLDAKPVVIAGHSAGAAIAACLCLRGSLNPRSVVSINGAMLPFGRAAAPVFSKAAQLLAASPVFTQLVALHAVPRKPVERMLRQTGSRTPPEMVRCYRDLLGKPRHVAATLRMMANWNLEQLEANLDRLNPALSLLVCDRDSVVLPAQGEELARRLPGSELHRIADLGHLGHEESPEWFAEQVRRAAARS